MPDGRVLAAPELTFFLILTSSFSVISPRSWHLHELTQIKVQRHKDSSFSKRLNENIPLFVRKKPKIVSKIFRRFHGFQNNFCPLQLNLMMKPDLKHRERERAKTSASPGLSRVSHLVYTATTTTTSPYCEGDSKELSGCLLNSVTSQ